MNESHGEKTSFEQDRDEHLTPEQIDKLEGSRTRYEDKVKNKIGERRKGVNLPPGSEEDLRASIDTDAILENHLRDEIKKRGISISEEDLAKIMRYSTVGASDVDGKSFEAILLANFHQ